MVDQGGSDLDTHAQGATSRAALLHDVSDIRDRASALGLDLVRWFLDMAVLELSHQASPDGAALLDEPSNREQ